MEKTSSFSAMEPPAIDSENFNMWELRMKAYPKDLYLLKEIKEDNEVLPLP